MSPAYGWLPYLRDKFIVTGVMTVKPENSVNYYYAVQALRLLVERGLLSEAEYEKASRYCAGIFQPERGYI